MARRKSKIQPAVMTMAFALPNGAATSTIDLSQAASLMNRRFYRQGINWAVAGFKIISPAGATGSLSVAQLPNTWVTSNAWEKSFRTWTRMNNEALAESESVRPKFLDYKIFADSTHHAAGSAANLLPVDFAGADYVDGMWEYSKFIIPDTTQVSGVREREVIAVGANYPGVGPSGLDAVSMIEGYAASRALPNIVDPNTPNDALSIDGATPANWLTATFNDGTQQTDAVITDMVTENNQAPYPYEDDGVNFDTMYPGGANQAPTMQYHDSALVSGTTIGGITQLKGGNFPCGLIRVASNIDAPNTLFVVNLIPGNHRGYLCEPMTEM